MRVNTIFLLIISLWFLICLLYIGQSAYRKSIENHFNPVLWVFAVIIICVFSFTISYLLFNFGVGHLIEVLGFAKSFMGLLLGRVMPALIGVLVSFKLTFYIIDNMKEIETKFGGKRI